MGILLIRLSGPMQSWGLSSRFTERDTACEPSKSGVIGLLCAAIGRDRAASLADLVALRMGVRVDREGTVKRDFQTAGGGLWLGEPYGVTKADGTVASWANMHKFTVTSSRYYLADAVFLVGFEGDNLPLLQDLHEALARPRWTISLGRKAFVPGEPVLLPDGLREGQDLEAALFSYPWLLALQKRNKRTLEADRKQCIRFIFECKPGEDGEARQDVPISFAQAARRYGVRRVRETGKPWAELFKEAASCT
jgi:CRISPR system Cascade subunit CasD